MQGEVVYLYAFDVANAIETAQVQEILGCKPLPFEIRTDHTYPKDLPLYQPLAVEPPQRQVTLGGRPVRQLLRVYDVGVISVMMRASFEVEALDELYSLHSPRLDSSQTLDQVAREFCSEACQSLADVMLHSSPPSEPEAYTIFCFTEIGDVKDVNRWLADHRRAAAGLLTETAADRLSDAQISEVLRVQRSFTQGDVVVIDWDAALVIDLDGYMDDVLYVLELSNLQLEEYRWMDRRLDSYLDHAYEDLRSRRFGLFGSSTKILGQLRLFRIDVTKLSDEVSHIGKFFGDWFLARVYLGASERFYLDHWRISVEQRLDELDKLYSVVNADIVNRRMLWLECLIVVFFAVDLLLIVVTSR